MGCGGVINSTSGSIQSIDINRDGLYEMDLECVWQMALPQNLTIFLQFNRFDLVSTGCYDYLEVKHLIRSFHANWDTCVSPMSQTFTNILQFVL